MKIPVVLGLCMGLATPLLAQAETITTPLDDSNRGDGLMFDVTNLTDSIVTLDGKFASMVRSSETDVMDFRVYYKTGTHVGSETDAAAWTLLGADTVTREDDSAALVDFDVEAPLEIAPNGLIALYVTLGREGRNLGYHNGSGVGTELANDGVLAILEGANLDISSGAGSDFEGRLFSPRNFSGSIGYSVEVAAVPLPGGAFLLPAALGLFFMTAGKRKARA
ncbi:MAG: hypothetical protein ACK5MQ_09610 [Pikeienuella sp.]